jgi:hypothetical protein
MAVLIRKTERHVKVVAHHVASELSVVNVANAAIAMVLKLQQVLQLLVW